MQLRHAKGALAPSSDGSNKVTAVAWSPNSMRLAVATSDRVIHLFDDPAGERRDKFGTKPREAEGPRTYVVRGLAFSPDSTKLLVAQSDNIAFIYKLGERWGDKKSICNKFKCSVAVTAAAWLTAKPYEVIFGGADGKVRMGALRTNKSDSLYKHPGGSSVVSMCYGNGGTAVLSGHLDGSVLRLSFEDGGGREVKLFQHSCAPYALSCGASVLAAGADGKVSFYDTASGSRLSTFDYSNEPAGSSEFGSAAFNPTGHAAVAGSFDKFYVFTRSSAGGGHATQWSEASSKVLENMYTISAMTWRPDGSRLAVGGLRGGVELFDAGTRRHIYQGRFEFTYVSPSQVIVKRLSTGRRIVLKSHLGYEVQRINIYSDSKPSEEGPAPQRPDQYIVAQTPATLLLGDLESCKLSEIEWAVTGSEKFYFDNPAVCMIYNAGELCLLEYGESEMLGTCRTEHMSPFLISVRLSKGHGGNPDTKMIAYLIDAHTILIQDFVSGTTVATVHNESRIDWLELNPRGSHLLFRDKRRQLYMYGLRDQERHTLLNYVSYVQWVPDSDVVVAQNRGNLCVWYSVATPESKTVFPIRGEVVDIERAGGRTEVIVDESIQSVSYALDEALIEFGSAVEGKDYYRAINMLEPLELNAETEGMWLKLSEMALESKHLPVAEQCFAAIGDMAKAKYVGETRAAASAHAAEFGGDGMDAAGVRARLAVLNKQWKVAEAILLEQGKVNECIQMYTEAQRWKDAIDVADAKAHPDFEGLKRAHYQWLLNTRQEEGAGEIKEAEGDVVAAISLYLKAGMPGRAAQAVAENPNGQYPSELLENVAANLLSAGMHERAGRFFEELGDERRAARAYREGRCYRQVVELCRRTSPEDVVSLEDEWADWLMSQRHADEAVSHYIEAGQSIKAIEAALEARQWAKAAAIAEQQPAEVSTPFFARIARHYEASKQYEDAERYYVRCGAPADAVEMYTRADRWDAAHRVAVHHMSDSEASVIYSRRARELEAAARYKEAERMYLAVKQQDMAINMYKKAKMYDQMVRLVGTYRKDLLTETHLHLAQQLEGEGDLKQAEHHFLEAQEWKGVVQMYRTHDRWDDAIRVAKAYGGASASKQVAYAWAVSLGGEEGAKLLTKFGLMESAIDYAVESGAFMHAFELTRAAGANHKLPEVHLKYAMALEDDGRFDEAESEFVKASKPKEAIDMWVHQQDWDRALRVAESHDPGSIPDICAAQGKVAAEAGEHARAEQLFLKGKRPDMAVHMFRDASKWEDAIRVAEDYAPSMVAEIHTALAQSMASGGGGGGGTSAAGASAASLLTRAQALERGRDFSRAIDCYLDITKEHSSDLDLLEQAWERAGKLSIDKAPERSADVVGVCARRLSDIGRFEQAGELLEGVDAHRDAVEAYLRAKLWERARHAATAGGPQLVRWAEEQHAAALAAVGDAGALMQQGNVSAGIEVLAQQGQWNKVHELAKEQGGEAAMAYALKHAKYCCQSGDFVGGCAALAQNGCPAQPAHYEMYRLLAREVLSSRSTDGLEHLKGMLYSLMCAMRAGGSEADPNDLTDFEKKLKVAHWANVAAVAAARAAQQPAKAQALRSIAASARTSILRYVGEVPADKAFLEAGMACREAGRHSSAFVFLNRFLDITEAIDEDADASALELDNSDYVQTDIPFDFAIPAAHYLENEDDREAVRDQVLEMSMQQQVEQVLPTRACASCGAQTYEAAAMCHECKAVSDECCITGSPVESHSLVRVALAGAPAILPCANKGSFNTWVGEFGTCPLSGVAQQQSF